MTVVDDSTAATALSAVAQVVWLVVVAVVVCWAACRLLDVLLPEGNLEDV